MEVLIAGLFIGIFLLVILGICCEIKSKINDCIRGKESLDNTIRKIDELGYQNDYFKLQASLIRTREKLKEAEHFLECARIDYKDLKTRYDQLIQKESASKASTSCHTDTP